MPSCHAWIKLKLILKSSASTLTNANVLAHVNPISKKAGHCAVVETHVKFDYEDIKLIVCITLFKKLLV